MITRHMKSGEQENVAEVQENSNTNRENTISCPSVGHINLLKVYLDGLLYGSKGR